MALRNTHMTPLHTPPTLMLESIIMEKDRSREASSGVEAIRAKKKKKRHLIIMLTGDSK